MIVTNNEAWAKRARYLTTQAKDDPIEYIHNEIGYNYRLTNIQAAMGVAQMENLDEYITAKRTIAETYSKALKDVPGITPMREAEGAFSTYWMYTILINKEKYGIDNRQLLRLLADNNIQSRPLWQPIHLSKAHKDGVILSCPVAERLNADALSLPCSVGITQDELESVVGMVRYSCFYRGV